MATSLKHSWQLKQDLGMVKGSNYNRPNGDGTPVLFAAEYAGNIEDPTES